jgi:4-diphosphocytidyl-2-C-methyl-D-erythritol kinase
MVHLAWSLVKPRFHLNLRREFRNCQLVFQPSRAPRAAAFDSRRQARYHRRCMRPRVTILAPAKVNLHLQILGARGDGYHDLLSLFQAVSLADTVNLRARGPRDGFSLRGSFGFPAAENLVTKAVGLFRQETGLRAGIEAEVDKRIPPGSGMGGGSSDAAATLRALDALLGARLPARRLRELAEGLGSDVPFFMHGPAALVEGRGERVTPLQPRTDFALVALFPGLAVSTAEAFAWVDARRGLGAAAPYRPPGERGGPSAGSPDPAGLAASYTREPVRIWRFANDFEDAVAERLPVLRGLRDWLLEAGAASALLTGSGSAMVGVFARAEAARACVARAGREGGPGARAELLFPLASLPRIWYNRSMRIRHREATHGDYGYSHQEGRL